MSAWARLLDAAAPLADAFGAALRHPRLAQEALLREILQMASSSEFGREHRFATISDIDAYRSLVPIRGYDEFRPFVDRIAAGERNVLTADEVIAFEETGGSSGGAKLIPYTSRSLDAFGAGILPWLSDLLRSRPQIGLGRAYFAISPATRAMRRTQSGIPIGLASDDAYLGHGLSGALAALSIAPAEVAGIGDVEEWRIVTASHLVAAEDLSFVSIWSPTFFSGLLKALRSQAGEICALLRTGSDNLPRSPARADLLECLLESGAMDTARLWPRLDTISAWQDGASAPYARILQNELPGAYFQGKGLLATEGVVTLPLSLARAPVPALTSTFLEFIDAKGQSRLVDELERDAIYRVVLTNQGGLYRYDLADHVICCGHLGGGAAPMLRFIGRGAIASDLVGEKLVEAFVASCLGRLPGFCTIFPLIGPPPGYGLVIDAGASDEASGLCERIDRALRDDPQYNHARKHGQLLPLRPFPVARAEERYVEWALAQGRRLSDVKPPALIRDASLPRHIWPAEFDRFGGD